MIIKLLPAILYVIFCIIWVLLTNTTLKISVGLNLRLTFIIYVIGFIIAGYYIVHDNIKIKELKQQIRKLKNGK